MNGYKLGIKILSILSLIGIIILSIGIGATYQAQQDVNILNESLYNIATTNGILYNGETYYSVSLYNRNIFDLNTTNKCNEVK